MASPGIVGAIPLVRLDLMHWIHSGPPRRGGSVVSRAERIWKLYVPENPAVQVVHDAIHHYGGAWRWVKLGDETIATYCKGLVSPVPKEEEV